MAVVVAVLLKSQVAAGNDAGSWPASGQWTRNRGGKIMSTALRALSLEVYYRYPPMYSLLKSPPSRRRDK